jgi:Family of unknown function (DUF5683)
VSAHKIAILLSILLYSHLNYGQKTLVDSLRKKIMNTHVSVVTDSLGKTIVDTTTKPVATSKDRKIIPRTAAMRSLYCPGLGQIYNRQYWKVPIVYGALAGVVLGYSWNDRRYNNYVSVYKTMYDGTTLIKSKAEVYLQGSKTYQQLTLDQITRGKDFYRRWRDLNVIIFVGVWALNAVDANVTAHLKTFDMSDDISIRIEPKIDVNPYGGGVFGARAVMIFK